jgi:hypothetical protein
MTAKGTFILLDVGWLWKCLKVISDTLKHKQSAYRTSVYLGVLSCLVSSFLLQSRLPKKLANIQRYPAHSKTETANIAIA